MGKKTLEDLGKLIFMLIITTVINYYTSKRHLKDVELDGKLDKVNYEKDQKKKWDAHDASQIRDDKINAEFRLWMRGEMKGLRDDVRDIKK